MEDARIEVYRAEWLSDHLAIRSVREAVFVREQGVPEDIDFDGLDPLCYHVLAYAHPEAAVGTARMQTDGHIGRIAVLTHWRERGIGTLLVRALLELAIELRLGAVYLHSQAHAVQFYEKLGFEKQGDLFFEANMPHYKMVKMLTIPQL